MQGMWVQSLVGELKTHVALQPKKQSIKWKQYYNKCNEDFKKWSTLKKIFLRKKKSRERLCFLFVGYNGVRVKSLQLCLTLCDPVNYSPSGSSVHRILQARILEWVAMLSSRASPQPRYQTHSCLRLLHWQAGSLPLVPRRKPRVVSNTLYSTL